VISDIMGNKMIAYCFSKAMGQKRLNHYQGNNGHTLCGIPYIREWDFDCCDEKRLINLCKRCKKIHNKIIHRDLA